MKKKALLTLCLMAAATTGTWAQGPNNSANYYQNADGKSGEALKTALFNIISKKTKSPSYDDFLDLYKQTDTRPDGKVRDWYSNATSYVHIRDKAGSYSGEGDCYNREHLVPQSWGAPKAGDIIYVVPTDGWVNNQRGSLPLGEVGSDYKSSANGYSKWGASATPGYSGKVFEPNDEVKGDIARIYFYVATAYENTCTGWGSVFSGTKYQPLAQWTYNMMVRWSQLDPVDEVEIARNNTVALLNVQGNRNPFVDYPGLEEYIWGDKKNVPFSYDNYGSDMADRVSRPVFSPEEGTYANSVTVTISCDTEGADIYYTTDGSNATTGSTRYTGPITLTKTTTLKAIAAKEGMNNSYQQTATYSVYDPSAPVSDIVFALNNVTFGTTLSGALSGTDLRDYTATKDGVTITYGLGGGANMYMNDKQIRLYAGNTFTVTSSGSDITEMTFTLAQSSSKILECSTGSLSNYTWTGKAKSVVFSVNSGSGNMQLTQLAVKRTADTPAPKQGDVNADGQVDVADIAAIIDVMAAATTPGASASGPVSADVNADGQVDVADIAAVIDIMAGKNNAEER